MKSYIIVCILFISMSCSLPKTIPLRISITRDGYTYATNRYMVYRAKLDTVLKPGTIIRTTPTNCDTCKYLFKRIY